MSADDVTREIEEMFEGRTYKSSTIRIYLDDLLNTNYYGIRRNRGMYRMIHPTTVIRFAKE